MAHVILYIDDEEQAHSAIDREARRLPVAMTHALSGSEGISAYERARAAGQPFEAVITDFQMPFTDGTAVVMAIRGHDRQARIYLASSNIDIIPAHASDDAIILEKPLRKADLERILAQLDATRA